MTSQTNHFPNAGELHQLSLMEKHNGKITQTCNIAAVAQVEITADMSSVFSKTLSRLPRLHYTKWDPLPPLHRRQILAWVNI